MESSEYSESDDSLDKPVTQEQEDMRRHLATVIPQVILSFGKQKLGYEKFETLFEETFGNFNEQFQQTGYSNIFGFNTNSHNSFIVKREDNGKVYFMLRDGVKSTDEGISNKKKTDKDVRILPKPVVDAPIPKARKNSEESEVSSDVSSANQPNFQFPKLSKPISGMQLSDSSSSSESSSSELPLQSNLPIPLKPIDEKQVPKSKDSDHVDMMGQKVGVSKQPAMNRVESSESSTSDDDSKQVAKKNVEPVKPANVTPKSKLSDQTMKLPVRSTPTPKVAPEPKSQMTPDQVDGSSRKENALKLLCKIVSETPNITVNQLRDVFEVRYGKRLTKSEAEQTFGFQSANFRQIVQKLHLFKITDHEGSKVVKLDDDYLPTDGEDSSSDV